MINEPWAYTLAIAEECHRTGKQPGNGAEPPAKSGADIFLEELAEASNG